MNERKVHLARGESDLGVLPLKEVRELLASGFLRPDDEIWMAGQTGWLPLSLLPAVKTPDGGIYHKLKEALTSAAAVAQKSASNVTSRVTSVAGKPTEQLTAATNRMLEDYLPHLGASAQTALAQTSRSADAALRGRSQHRFEICSRRHHPMARQLETPQLENHGQEASKEPRPMATPRRSHA